VIRAASTRARSRAGGTGRVLRAAAAALLVVALGVFHIWCRTRVLATGYELGELTKDHARLASEHDRLRIEVETLRSPAALERYARTRLGMAPPAPGAVQAAGPRLAEAGSGRAGRVGVGHRSGPAEPSRPPTVLAAAGRAPPDAR
jgi:cell division protein FtsL